jgi:hypothetical protein
VTKPTAANPAILAKIAKLQEQLEAGKLVTAENILPFQSLEEADERARSYRRLVDKTMRQPFLGGLRPSPELVAAAKSSRERWGDLAASIRAGTPPQSLPVARAAALKLPGFNAAGGDPAKVTGALWSAMSDEYFRETLEVENLAADLAGRVRNSPAMNALADSMEHAERMIESARNRSEKDKVFALRSATWLLHRVWQLGVALQVKLLEREAIPNPDADALDAFLRDMDSARGLRHRGISLSRAGGGPPPSATPATLVREPVKIQVPPDGTIRAALPDAQASADVSPPAPNRLPQLAAELYHAHYLLRRVEAFERDHDILERKSIEDLKPGPQREARTKEHEESRRTRIAERGRDYEGRRLQVLHEMTQEADRVLPGLR